MAHLHIKDTVISDRRLPLPGRVVVMGRSLDVDVPVPHVSVSRRHALIEVTDTGFLLSDLGSSNGTFVNGERLEDGERREIGFDVPFRVGEVAFRVAADESTSAPAPKPVMAAAPRPVKAAAPTPGKGATPPVVNVTATSKVRPTAGATSAKVRSKPSTGLRATKRRERQMAMKWVGVLVTVALVGLAALFLVKILGMNGDEAPEATPAEAGKEEPKVRDWEIVPLTKPGK